MQSFSSLLFLPLQVADGVWIPLPCPPSFTLLNPFFCFFLTWILPKNPPSFIPLCRFFTSFFFLTSTLSRSTELLVPGTQERTPRAESTLLFSSPIFFLLPFFMWFEDAQSVRQITNAHISGYFPSCVPR